MNFFTMALIVVGNICILSLGICLIYFGLIIQRQIGVLMMVLGIFLIRYVKLEDLL